MSSVRRAALAAHLTIGWIAIAGCSDGSTDPTALDAGISVAADIGFSDGATIPAGPTIELGAGLTGFRALNQAGDEVELVFGPQGGWHIDLAIRVLGFQPVDVNLTYTATSAARTFGQIQYEVTDGRKFVVAADGWERAGDRIIFDITDSSEVVGQTLTVSVELTAGPTRIRDDRSILIVDRR